jgi:hypothetical protein
MLFMLLGGEGARDRDRDRDREGEGVDFEPELDARRTLGLRRRRLLLLRVLRLPLLLGEGRSQGMLFARPAILLFINIINELAAHTPARCRAVYDCTAGSLRPRTPVPELGMRGGDSSAGTCHDAVLLGYTTGCRKL